MISIKDFDSHLLGVDLVIDKVLSNAPLPISNVMEHLKYSKGKGIRALTILAVADSLGEIDNQIIDIAATTELMHLATLIHDDIIDDAPLRRGRASIQSQFGKKMAVLTGDYLFTQCFSIIAKYNVERMADFSKAVSYVCIGEAMQLNHNFDYSITYKDYKKIITGKTAALFALSTYAPAKALKIADTTCETLGRAGYYMGLVFQMIDDCLDYSGNSEITKKEIMQDLLDGVITYPLIFTISKNPKIKDFLADISNVDINYLVKEVVSAGGVTATKHMAKKYYDLSKKKFIKALGHEKSKVLIEILDKVYYRES